MEIASFRKRCAFHLYRIILCNLLLLLCNIFLVVERLLEEAVILVYDYFFKTVIEGLEYPEAEYIQFFFWFRLLPTQLVANRQIIPSWLFEVLSFRNFGVWFLVCPLIRHVRRRSVPWRFGSCACTISDLYKFLESIFLSHSKSAAFLVSILTIFDTEATKCRLSSMGFIIFFTCGGDVVSSSMFRRRRPSNSTKFNDWLSILLTKPCTVVCSRFYVLPTLF